MFFFVKEIREKQKNFVVALHCSMLRMTHFSVDKKGRRRWDLFAKNNVIDYYPTLRNVIASWDLSLLLFPSYECIHKSFVYFPPNFSGYGISFLENKQFLFLNSNFPPKPCQQKLWVFQGLKFASDDLHMIDYQQKIGLFAASKFLRLDFACELNYIQKKYHKHL